jgi:hypothetical protein
LVSYESLIEKVLHMGNRTMTYNLKIINPKLSNEWHPTKNCELKPKDVTPGSGKKVWWICNNGHEWKAIVGSRSNGAGCPFCAGQRTTMKNCLETTNPDLAKQWHPAKNGNLTPKDIRSQSHEKVWWVCSQGHEWQAKVYSRTAGCGCPYCSGHRACDDNSLQTANPVLANLNGLGLQSVIQDFNGLWSKQSPGAFLYLSGSDFFLLMP